MSTLGYLANFHAVCQTLNISAAAETLGMTQPSLSRQLKRLEESLGFPLFVRRQRGIELTPEGAKLAEAVAPALTALDERLNLLKNQSGSARGKLRIGSLTELGKSLVMPTLIRFMGDFPDAELEVHFLKGTEIIQALQEQALDFGVLAERPEVQALRVTTLGEERSVVVTRKANPRSLATTGDVLAAGFVAYREGDPLLQAFLAVNFPALGRQRIKPKFAVNDHKSMIDFLMVSDLFAVMPIQSVSGHLAAGTLRVASEKELNSAVYLARPAKPRDSLLTESFLAALHRAIAATDTKTL